jgi:predicted nucleotide-binding protein (sugar kinase/HSP70/actin superfamily)
MPESTVAPVLDAISEDYSLPVLRLVFDEHSGEAGVDTRLEAFVDILKRKKKGHKRSKGRSRV